MQTTETFIGAGDKMPIIMTQEPWYSEIVSGRKRVEARVGKPNHYNSYIGNYVSISIGRQSITKRVIDVRHYETLHEYIVAEGWQNVAPHVVSEEAALTAYRQIKTKTGAQVYSDENIASRGGVTAIAFE